MSEKISKHNIEIKTSGDFENDPQGAIDALDKTGFAVFMITKAWFDDKRAQKEWRFAKDLGKPMLYIIDKEQGVEAIQPWLYDVPLLIGTINHYGDMKKTASYVQGIIVAYEMNLNKKE